MAIDVAAPNDSNIKKKKDENMEKDQGLKKMWKVKTKVVPVMVGALEAVAPKLESGSNKSHEQYQISLSRVQWEGQLRYVQNPQSPRPLVEDFRL